MLAELYLLQSSLFLHALNIVHLVNGPYCIFKKIIILQDFFFQDGYEFSVRSPYDLGKKLRNFEEFWYNVGMIVNTNKINLMIIKFKNITYDTISYIDNNNLEEVFSHKYL